MLKSSLCDYSDAYILVKATITVPNTAAADPVANKVNKKVIFKNCATLINYISKINNKQVDKAKHIDIVMPMYNLIEQSDNYSKTSGILQQYCKSIPAKVTGQTGDGGTKRVEIMVPLKNLSNCFRTLEMPLINCEINLLLTLSASYVMLYI